MNYLNKLIRNNTGVSSKNFFLVLVTMIGCLLLLVPVFTLTIEAIFTHTIATDLTGYAAYIGAVSAVLASGGFTKVISEKYEKPWENNDEEMFEDAPEKPDCPPKPHTRSSDGNGSGTTE